MPVEVCFLIGGQDVLWADSAAQPAALPDSRGRWQAIWRLRGRLTLIAHTHPSGLLRFSDVDRSTMAAIDTGLGRRLDYAVVTADAVLLHPASEESGTEPWWVALIRASSGMEKAWRS